MNLNSVVNNLEKISTFRFFFLFSSFIMIFEIISIFFLNTNIMNVDFDFIKNNVGYILILIAIFSLLANIIPLTLSYFIRLVCRNREVIQSEKDNYIDKDDLLIKALKNQNSVDYQYLQQHEEEESNLQGLKNYSLLFSFTLFINYFFTNSIMKNLEIYLKTHFLLTIFFSILGFALFLFIQIVLCTFTNKVYYPKEVVEETQQNFGEK